MALTVNSIRAMILERDDALEKAIIRIYEGQTENEKNAERTSIDNGVGFNSVDAQFLSSLAKQIMENKYNKPLGYRLSCKQRDIARKKMVKYAGQIFRIFVEPNQKA
jgi:hypothetical protein